MRKQVLSAALAAALLAGLAGCANTPAVSGATPATARVEATTQTAQPDSSSPVDATAAMGRWVESPIDLGGEYCLSGPPVRMDDGSLRMLGFDYADHNKAGARSYFDFTSDDNGATWKSAPVDWGAEVEGSAYPLALGSDGSRLYSTWSGTAEDGTPSRSFYLRRPGEAPKSLPLEAALLDGAVGASGGAFLDKNTLVLCAEYPMEGQEGEMDLQSGGPNQLYDLTTDTAIPLRPDGTVTEDFMGLNGAGCSTTAAGAASLVTLQINYTNKTGALYEVDKTGAVHTLMDPLPGTDNLYTGTTGADGSYYYAGQNGLYRLAKGGTLPEEIIAPSAFRLGSLTTKALCQTSNGDFILVLQNQTSSAPDTLCRYHWDTTLPTEKASAITVWSLEDNATVRAAMTAFTTAEPDVDVNYTVGLADGAGPGKEDVLRTLNTELLSGAGPDVLILDGVDYESYAAGGLLADLSPALDTGALVQNIAAPFINEGKIYAMPARFGVPLLFGDAGSVESLTGPDALQALQKAVLACPPRADADSNSDAYYTALADEQKFGLSFLSVDQLLQFAMESSAPALLDGDAVNTGAVRQVLDFVQAVGGYYDMKNYRPAAAQSPNGIATDSGEGTDEVSMMDNAVEYMQTGRAKYGWETLLTTSLFGCFFRNEQGVGAGRDNLGAYVPASAVPRPGLTEGAYLPATLAGVNAASGKQAQALEFITALFGEETQNSYTADGLPVRQTALDAMIARNRAGKRYELFKGDAAALIAACKTPVITNDTLNAAMLTHAKALIDGAEDLDAAVSGVEGDLGLYLAEQK